jgi:hypothetical protein
MRLHDPNSYSYHNAAAPRTHNTPSVQVMAAFEGKAVAVIQVEITRGVTIAL